MNKYSTITFLNTIVPAIEAIDGGCPYCISDFCKHLCKIFPDFAYDGVIKDENGHPILKEHIRFKLKDKLVL